MSHGNGQILKPMLSKNRRKCSLPCSFSILVSPLFACDASAYGVGAVLASSPGLRGGGERRPGIDCMRMRHIFSGIFRKNVRKVGGHVHKKVLRNEYTESHAFNQCHPGETDREIKR